MPPKRPWLTVLCVSLALTCASGRIGLAEDLTSRGKALEERLIADLEGLATWSSDARLFAKRDDAYVALLQVAPDHAAARKWLKYARASDGAWRQDPKYKRPVDWVPGLLPEWGKRLETARRSFLDGILAAVLLEADPAHVEAPVDVLVRGFKAFPDDRGFRDGACPLFLGLLEKVERATPAYDRVVEAADPLFPDDAAIRTALGEEREGGKWLLAETLPSRRRRDDLIEAVRKILGDAGEPKTILPADSETALGLAGLKAVKVNGTRVLGTVALAALERLARCLDTAPTVFRATLGAREGLPSGFEAFVLRNHADRDVFFSRFPGITERERRDSLVAGGMGVGNGTIVVWSGDGGPFSLDMTLRMAYEATLSVCFGFRGSLRDGCLVDAFGRYLTYRHVGTRLTFMMDRDYAGTDALRGARLRNGQADWFEEAITVFASGDARDLQLSLGRGVDAATPDDLLRCYAFAAFVIETHPRVQERFLRLLARGTALEELVRDTLGFTVVGLQRRLLRWLRERVELG